MSYQNNQHSNNQKIHSPPPDYGWRDYSAMPNNAHLGMAEAGITRESAPKNILFDDKAIRAAFIRKVFITVAIMLAVVAVITALPKIHTETGIFIRQNGAPFAWGSLILFICMYFVLVCSERARRTYPTNIILTGIFTVAAGVLSMMIASHYALESILMALIITIIACGGVVVYASTTKRDLTGWISALVIASFCMCAFGLVASIATSVYHVHYLRTIYSLFGALLMMAWLAFDIQMLMGGRDLEVSPEDHIFIAVQLFIDILYVFWHILEAVGTDDQ